ncbi:MAG: transposase [Proteobacteria bacterium]|nr:transposase [Pseudomonadota bacterium]
MEPRKLKGAQIAKAGGVRVRGDSMWLVPSQSHTGSWVVDYYDTDKPTCTCPDFASRWAMCKHIFAIEIIEHRLNMPEAPPPKKQQYNDRDWSKYDAGQMNEGDNFVQLLHGLCQCIGEPAQTGRGRPRLALADVVFSAVLKQYEGKSLRRLQSDQRRLQDQGYTLKVVSFNSLARYMRDPAMMPLLRKLVQESASPLADIEREIAMDASGFSTSVRFNHLDNKHGNGKGKRKDYIKAHAACGTVTKICTDLVVTLNTGKGTGDPSNFKPLLQGTSLHFDIDKVLADKAYSTHAILQAVHDMGAVPYIPFKDGSTDKHGPDIWKRMYHFVQLNEAEFLSHYHQRSNVETMFSMVKQKFDRHLKAKDEIGLMNEVYCKFLAHNIVVLANAMYQHDLRPTFMSGSVSMKESA